MSGHTPGPWHVGSPPPHMPDNAVFDEREILIASTGGMQSNLPEHEDALMQQTANARLIAAAPELYDIVREWLNGRGDLHPLHGKARELLDRIDAQAQP